MASSASLQPNPLGGLTLTFLGCGTMGIAILSGILSSLASTDPQPSTKKATHPSISLPPSGTNTPSEELPPRLPSQFLACVRRPESAKRIKNALPPSSYPNLTVLQNENVKAVKDADIIILGCKPQMVADVLAGDDMRAALAGKLLVSICAGVTVDRMTVIIYGESPRKREPARPCRIVRAMPNTASFVRESMTVIATPSPPLPDDLQSLITWIFTRIGRVVFLPDHNMDASTALCGSGPAFFALILEAIADGAVAMGLPRAEAQLMAAQTMRGTSGLVLGGEHPALVREKVSTPGGCTIGGLLVLEEGRVRGSVARAVREATDIASQLGMGAKSVNGTRRFQFE
ncbi:MAG: delta 1-pyrroline-5-carboxylate reductase [Vezdaea aestivalis]|nr:MAG: delta 1-pyrroline-5-carboxylate reductase [Vezdaea aestivalis]